MRTIFLLIFGFFSILTFSQNVNNYEFVIVPKKFDFQKTENEHRLSTLLKFRFEEYGFRAFYTSEQTGMNYADRCDFLNATIVDESGMFVTKLYIELKNCKNEVVFKSAVGSSRAKDRKTAYNEALEGALVSVKNLNYKFEGNSKEKAAIKNLATIEKLEISYENSLFAQSIPNGFQLVDITPKVVLKIYKTSMPDYFITNKEGVAGVVFKKNDEWFLEYYLNEKLISEKLTIKF